MSRSKHLAQRFDALDAFFEGTHPVQRTMRRLASDLRSADIPFALMGGMAVCFHGGNYVFDDVDYLVTADGLRKFREMFAGRAYESVPSRPRRFVDRESQTCIHFHRAGDYPRGRGPIAFPHPDEATDVMGHQPLLSLPQLVNLKLAARRFRDLGDVTCLIKFNELDESFLSQLHPAVHSDYLLCLEEVRWDDRHDAQPD